MTTHLHFTCKNANFATYFQSYLYTHQKVLTKLLNTNFTPWQGLGVIFPIFNSHIWVFSLASQNMALHLSLN